MLLSLVPYSDNRKVLNKRFPLLVFFLIFILLLSLRDVTCGADLILNIRSLPVVHRVEVLIRTTAPLQAGEHFKILRF